MTKLKKQLPEQRSKIEVSNYPTRQCKTCKEYIQINSCVCPYCIGNYFCMKCRKIIKKDGEYDKEPE